jgi:hypothetical protein
VAVGGTVKVTTLVHVGFTGEQVEAKLDTPEGAPETVSETVCGVPLVSVSVIVFVPN